MLGWIPQIDSGRPLRVLCLGAHPDDIEIGCGASLMALAEKFHSLEVCWVVFSGDSVRSAEARASAGFWLEAVAEKRIDLHGFRDGFFPGEWAEIKAEFERLKRGFEPDLVFSHARADLHQDHRIVGELTWNTFRNHAILEYEVPKYDGDLETPNFYVPVAEQAARAKAAALARFFGSQRDRHWFAEELFLGLMRLRGMESRAPSGYAEGFHMRKGCMGL